MKTTTALQEGPLDRVTRATTALEAELALDQAIRDYPALIDMACARLLRL